MARSLATSATLSTGRPKKTNDSSLPLPNVPGFSSSANNTYKTFSAPLPGRLHIVLTSDTSDKINIPGQVEYTSASPEEIVADLEERGYAEVILAGGGQVNTLFLKANLIDELLLTLEPVVFGSGIDLFRSGELDARWRLASMEKLNDIGSLHLRYSRD
nr:RibD C-terminal domain protein [uncultured bacterium]